MGARGAGPRPARARRRAPPRPRLGRSRHVLAQGLHPAHDALPRPLPLLHVREAAREARRAVPHARRGRSRSRGAVVRARARRRCSPSATGRRTGTRSRGVARRPRVRLDARVRARVGDQRDRGDRAPPAPEPGRHELRGARAAEAGERVDGADARDRPRTGSPERGGAHFGSPDKHPAVRLRTIEDAGRLAIPFTTGHPRRDRRRRAGARRVGVRDPRAAPPLRTHPGGDRPELPREAAHGDGGRARARATRRSSPRSPPRGSCWART